MMHYAVAVQAELGGPLPPPKASLASPGRRTNISQPHVNRRHLMAMSLGYEIDTPCSLRAGRT